MIQQFDINLWPTYGVILAGVLFATFFQGILTVQVYSYYQDFPKDPKRTKIFVAVLWILDFFHLILISYTVFYYLVTNWGNLWGISRFIIPFCIHLFPIAFSILLCQLFFLHRIWLFSQRNALIVGPVFVCSLVNFGLIIAAGVLSMKGGFRDGLIPLVLVGAITDVLIAGLLCYYVRKRSEGARDMRVTNILVTQVIRYTVATSALTSLLVLACLFAYIASPFTFIYIALHFSSGRTYANAVLVNLNARRKFRETLESLEPSFAKSAELGGVSSAVRRMPRSGHNMSSHDHSFRVPTTSSRSIPGGSKFDQAFTYPPNVAYPPRTRYSMP